MKFSSMATVSLAALALGACAPASDDQSMETGEDTAMTTTDTVGEPGMDAPSSPEDTAGSTDNAQGGDATEPAAGDACGAGKVSRYVGQEATPDVRARITADVGHTRIRWVGPDTVVTMDYSPERLNVTMDGNGVITGGNCA